MVHRACAGRIPLLALIFVVLFAGCASSEPGRPAARVDPGQPAAPAAASTGPKSVTVAFDRQVTAVEVFGGGSTGRQTVMPLVHNLVVYEKEYQLWVPQLALDQPSLEAGTWKINPDGTMEMTWHFRPNIKWHDGTPFSAEDIVFAVALRKDPEMGSQSAVPQGRLDLITSLRAPDPLTLVTSWSAPYVDADRARSLEPIPRHILQDLYGQDKRAVQTSSYWNTDFVGLGPYRVVKWDQGTQIELARFDDYYMGRPKLDTIFIKFISDDNALVAAFLAGAVDVATDQSDLSIDGARELERRWRGMPWNQVRYDPNGALGNLQIQFREEYARPHNGFTNRAVRDALYRALDRATLTEVLTDGIAPVADSWYHPSHPLRKDVESAIPQFPYDPAAAQQELTQAGWVRGSDGILVNQQSGERFESDVWATGSDLMRWAVAISDQWKGVGAEFTQREIPAALAAGAGFELTSKRAGPKMLAISAETLSAYRSHSASIPTEANRWVGPNDGGYNPRVDALIDRIARTIDPREKIQAHRDLVQEMMGEVGIMPLWWVVTPVATANGVRGVRTVTIGGTLSSFEWDKD